jgi:hypothetical protein
LARVSDISGQDIRAHGGDAEHAIREVRDWLRAVSSRRDSGSGEIIEHYRRFSRDLPDICRAFALEPDRLTFLDLSQTIAVWLRAAR